MLYCTIGTITDQNSLQKLSLCLLQDSYFNLTLKTVMGLKWKAMFCPQAKIWMKTDDDIFVNLPYLHKAMTEEGNFRGHIIGNQGIPMLAF